MLAHTLYVAFWPKPAGGQTRRGRSGSWRRACPERVKRHSLAARAVPLDHGGVDARRCSSRRSRRFSDASSTGCRFTGWPGIVLTISIIYHIIHATFWLDFWSIWLNKEDVAEATTRVQARDRRQAPRRRARRGSIPWDNKMYHTAIVLSALAVVPTGLFMMVARAHAALDAQPVSLQRRAPGA